MSVFYNEDGRGVLLNMVSVIQDNKQMLSDIDGLIGDGDHGMNMNKGFTIFKNQLGNDEITFSDGLYNLGSVLLNKIGGSMGPIYGAIFMGMAEIADGHEVIDAPLFCTMLKAGLDELYEIIDARPGDKTLVDSYYPAVEAFKASEGKDFSVSLRDMVTACEAGCEATKDMIARHGRAARLGERSRGFPDAGATSCRLLLCAIADGIMQVLR